MVRTTKILGLQIDLNLNRKHGNLNTAYFTAEYGRSKKPNQ